MKIVLPVAALLLLVWVVATTSVWWPRTPDIQWQECKIVEISSADTLIARLWISKFGIKLAGISDPGDYWSKTSREFLAELVNDKSCLFAKTSAIGNEGRFVGILRLNRDGETIEINKIMLQEGQAKWDKATSYDKSLEALEIEAKRARRGIWSQ
jgi:endonuclease YncB( thermonuclease family)